MQKLTGRVIVVIRSESLELSHSISTLPLMQKLTATLELSHSISTLQLMQKLTARVIVVI